MNKEQIIQPLKTTAKKLLDLILYVPRRIQRFVVHSAVKALTDPITLYSPSEVTNLRSLKRRLKPCDVLLVCGNARISHVVKLLTISQWSHVVLYVGDRRDLLTPKEIEEWRSHYGDSALEHLVIDADPLRGVHLRPVDEYVGLMVRHCRPDALTAEDSEKVLRHALSELGRQYDIGHIIRLLFFFAFPWEFLPESLRRFATDFTLSESDRICSRVLSEAFHSVGYPIRPLEVIQNRRAVYNQALSFASGITHRGKSAARLLAGGRLKSAVTRLTSKRYIELHQESARHVTPADYDLSRFFSIIKDENDLAIEYNQAAALCPLPRRWYADDE